MRLPVMMLLCLSITMVLCDLYIWYDIRSQERRNHRQGDRIYAVSALVLWLVLAVSIFQPYRSEDMNILPLMWVLYSFLAIYTAKLVYIIFSLIGRLPQIIGKKPIRLGTYAGIPLAFLLLLGAAWGATGGRRQIEVIDVTVQSPKVPKAFDGYRIAQFSDAHLGTWGEDTTFVSKLVNEINAQKPDIILFTGDLVNRYTDEALPFVKVLSRLYAPDGVYSILGNHDYGDYVDWPSREEHETNNQRLVDLQERMGWHMLLDSTAFLTRNGQQIALIGVENWGEPPFKTYGDLSHAYPIKGDSIGSLNDSRFKILMTHNPEHWNRVVRRTSNIDLSLAGHTHAMQFMVRFGNWKWSPAKYKYEQWGGLYPDEHHPERQLYVNIGCGEVGMPFRIGATPEITVITLRSK